MRKMDKQKILKIVMSVNCTKERLIYIDGEFYGRGLKTLLKNLEMQGLGYEIFKTDKGHLQITHSTGNYIFTKCETE